MSKEQEALRWLEQMVIIDSSEASDGSWHTYVDSVTDEARKCIFDYIQELKSQGLVSTELLPAIPGSRYIMTAIDPFSFIVSKGWISVEDGLPEEEIDVLTYGDWGIQQGMYVPNFWSLCGGDNLASVDQVTHWMPLPESPKE